MVHLDGPITSAAQSVRAAASTAVFFLKVLPMLPSGPLRWVTPTPVVERLRYPTRDGEAEGDVYRPAGPGPYPGIVVCLGVVPFGVDHPQVPRLGESLARAGFAALLYWSPAMRDLRLDPEDTENLALAFKHLIEQPYVAADRSGLLGTCVGSAFALMAAADARVRDRVAFVTAFAPFSSMWTLGRDIASATRSDDGSSRPWPVDQITRKVFVRSFTAMLDPAEAEQLRVALAEPGGQIDEAGLSPEARAVAPLLIGLDAERAWTALERLPETMRERLTAMSPMTYLDDIHAPLIVLLHDRDDLVVPVGESRRLSHALDGRAGVRYTELGLFEHADPTKRKLSPLRLARELARFYGAAYPIFRCSVAGGPALDRGPAI